MAIILLIRHGDNDWAGHKLAGRLPGVHLNPRGREQAAWLAQTLKDAPLRAIYASPLERTLETAAPLAEAVHLAVQPEDGLLEVDFGEWQGRELKQLRRLKLWQQLHADAASFTFPGGESINNVRRRAVAVVQAVEARLGEYDAAALFSHGDIIRLLLTHYLNMPLADFHRLVVDTGSITIIQTGGKLPHILGVNLNGRVDWPRPGTLQK